MEKQHKEFFIQNNLDKSAEAMRVAKYAIDDSAFISGLNRIYYAIFYVVTALGYKYGFTTSKHSKLMGWFNKKFINEDKTFKPELYKIYEAAFANRQQSDYKSTYIVDEEFVKSLFEEAQEFIKQVNKII